MLIKIGLENGNENRSQAWALDLPGCFSYGKDGREALIAIPLAVVEYENWIGKHTPNSWLKDLGDFDVRLTETFEVYDIDDNFELADEGYSVNSWFRHDWKILTTVEVDQARQMLTWAYSDLMAIVSDLNPAILAREYGGERWSIRGIIGHIATANWWYLDRLDLATANRSDLPDDQLERLDFVHNKLMDVLPSLVGLNKTVGKDGEFWSPRKLIRRAIWHERDHNQHIQKLLLTK